MEHSDSILFHKSGAANKQYTYQRIIIIALIAINLVTQEKVTTDACL